MRGINLRAAVQLAQLPKSEHGKIPEHIPSTNGSENGRGQLELSEKLDSQSRSSFLERSPDSLSLHYPASGL